MQTKKRFIITEIYQNDLHSVDKVLVDLHTNVQYLLHQEGSGCSCTPLIDPLGLPLLYENPTPHPDSIRKPKQKKEEVDQICERKHDEPIEKIKPVKIKKKRKSNNDKNNIM